MVPFYRDTNILIGSLSSFTEHWPEDVDFSLATHN